MISAGDSAPDSLPYVQPTVAGVDAWAREASALGGTGTQQLLEVTEIVAPAVVSEALLLAESATVVVRRRLILLDSVPVELADSYYPAHVALGTALAQPAKVRGGAPAVLAQLGFRPAVCAERIRVRPTTSSESELLLIEQGALVIELCRVTRDASGVPFEFTMMAIRPEGRTLRYQFAVGEGTR